jgi:hypothetical protein
MAHLRQVFREFPGVFSLVWIIFGISGAQMTQTRAKTRLFEAQEGLLGPLIGV